MKEMSAIDWVPGIESETRGNGSKKSLICSILVSLGLFFLLPLSELVRNEEWIVREVESVPLKLPPPPKTKLEKKTEEIIRTQSVPQPLETKSPILKIKIGGAPNDVFNASLYFGLPSGPITGIV